MEVFKHKSQGDVQKKREQVGKNLGKAMWILQSKKGIYPLFAEKKSIVVAKLTCLIHKTAKMSKQSGNFDAIKISYLFHRHVGSHLFLSSIARCVITQRLAQSIAA